MLNQTEQAIAQGAAPKAIAQAAAQEAIALKSTKDIPSSLRLPQSERPESSFFSSRPGIPGRQPIALILVHRDPAVEVGNAIAGQTVYVRQIAEALATLGWQVDLFTRKTNPTDETVVQHSPYCRTIRLVAGPQEFIPREHLFDYLPEFVEAFEKFYSKAGTNYPLVHTHYWLSAWVGLQLKKQTNIQLVHTNHSLGEVKYKAVSQRPPIAETRIAVERQVFEQASCVVATNLQEQEVLHSLISPHSSVKVIPYKTDLDHFRQVPNLVAREQNLSWFGVANQLSHLYRRLLAQSIMDSRLWDLPLPSPWETTTPQVERPKKITVAKRISLVS